jgi:excisionase family DNA binding protein
VTASRQITLQEAADQLGVHYMTVYRYVRTGRLNGVKRGSIWLVEHSEVSALTPGAEPVAVRRSRPGSRAVEQFEQRLLAGDESGAWTLVETALVSGAEPADIHLDYLAPSLESIGARWAAGELDVADEHRASAVATRIIARLGPRFTRRGRKRGTVVIGAPADDHHQLPGAIVADHLRGAGYEVVDLGANTPAGSFVHAAAAANRLVGVLIGATTPDNERNISAAVAAVREAELGAPVLIGGAAIADDAHAQRLGADFWTGRSARDVVAAVEVARA